MAISIRQLHPVFVGEVDGVDLRRPLTAEEVAAIEAGMDRYAVLVFHGQPLSDEQQVAFSRNFGEIEPAVNSNVTMHRARRYRSDEVRDMRRTTIAGDGPTVAQAAGVMAGSREAAAGATAAQA